MRSRQDRDVVDGANPPVCVISTFGSMSFYRSCVSTKVQVIDPSPSTLAVLCDL